MHANFFQQTKYFCHYQGYSSTMFSLKIQIRSLLSHNAINKLARDISIKFHLEAIYSIVISRRIMAAISHKDGRSSRLTLVGVFCTISISIFKKS